MNTVTTFTSFTTSNCYIVKPYNDERCIFIDLPPDLENALEYVNKENLTIMGALITHGHFDHALGMEKFNYGKYLSLEDEFLARNPQEQIKMFMGDDTGVNEYKGDILDVEKHEFDFLRIHKNPGHTKGSVSYEFPQLGIVFTGDFVFKDGIGRTDLKGGSIDEMKDSLNNIFLNLNKDLSVFPGHGPYSKVNEILNSNITLRELLND